MPPKDAHVLIPKICEDVTLHGKRDFTDIIHFEMRRLDYPSVVNLITWALKSVKGRWKVS